MADPRRPLRPRRETSPAGLELLTKPPRLRVFSGEWLENTDPVCRHRYREGFAGLPVRTWNGWQVFSVSPPVMRAIIDSHHADVVQQITASIARGLHADQRWLGALRHMASVLWLGNLVVVDSQTMHSDPTMVEVVAPDDAGHYRVGFGWSWDQVDPAAVHTIHGGGAPGGQDPQPESAPYRPREA